MEGASRVVGTCHVVIDDRVSRLQATLHNV